MLVYVIDDEKFILKLLDRSLKKDNHSVKVFDSGIKFISEIATLPKPDIILLDVVMPGLNGLEVLEKLTHHYNNLQKQLPYVVFMSAYDQTGILTKYLAKEGVWFIPKPFGINELRMVFSEITRHDQKTSSGAYPATPYPKQTPTKNSETTLH